MPGPELTGYNLEKDLKVDELQKGLREPALGYKHLERVGEKVGYIPPTTGTDAEFNARIMLGIADPVMVGGAAATTARQITKASKAADAKPIFTSPGETAAADIAKEKIPANKVRSQLEGRGVNKDEMEWTGFNEWIKTKKGEVSKAEIKEFFAQNQIEVREVVRGGKGSLTETQMEEIATNEVLHDLESDYYRNRIIEKINQNQADEMGGGINDPAVLEAWNESSMSSQGFLKWDDLTKDQQQGFATRYRIDNDIPGLPESAVDDAIEEYDLLLRSWGEGTITEAEMNKLNGLFDDIGSPNQADRMYQNTLAEIESGEYSLEQLNIEGAGLQTKFADPNWQLPGGENYRELLLIVPPNKPKITDLPEGYSIKPLSGERAELVDAKFKSKLN